MRVLRVFHVLFYVSLIGGHFHFIKNLHHSQKKYEELTGKTDEPKGWGKCGWKKGWKKHHKHQQVATVVQQQPVQQVSVVSQQPVVEYSQVYTSAPQMEIQEEADKDMGGMVFAPAPVQSTLTITNHQMV